jgi:hypothetical protein
MSYLQRLRELREEREAIQEHKGDLAETRPAEPVQAHKAELLGALTAHAMPAEVLAPATAEDLAERYTERAASMEHDGGLPREQADEQARQTVFQGRHAYHFTLSDYPTEAPVVITFASTVAEARRELERRFGDGRVIACWRVGAVRL